MSSEGRIKVDLLAGLVHEGIVQPLATWLYASPSWMERFLTELLDDGFVALAAAPSLDSADWLAGDKARALLSSGEPRAAYDVWLVPSPKGSRDFDESNVRAMFAYCEASISHLGGHS